MPIKVKDKFTGEIVDTRQSEIGNYPPNIWDVVYSKDLVRVYEIRYGDESRKYDHGVFEKEDARWKISSSLNIDYRAEPVPDVDLLENEDFKKDKPFKITAIAKHAIIKRTPKLTLSEWAAVFTIVAGVIALFMYVIIPFIKWIFGLL